MDLALAPPLEILTITAPFGVRFWDVAAREFVRFGLSVTAVEAENPLRPIATLANRSGVWILRGLRIRDQAGEDFEWGDGGAAFWQTWRAPVKAYEITARDLEGRFLPFRFVCGAPQRGFARCGCPLLSPPASSATRGVPADAVPMYPASTRPAPSGMAVVRAQLMEPPDPSPPADRRWAAWAFVEALADGEVVAASYADREGRVALMFPWPRPAESSLLSPPSPPGASGAGSLTRQIWRVRLRAFYDSLPRDRPPEICAVLAQRPARLWRRLGIEPLADSDLAYAQELVIRSRDDGSPPAAARSELLITPGA